MLTANEIQTFLAAAEAQSFSGAARKLCLTQSAVSQQIKKVERRLAVELFERKGGRISLTEDGRALVPLARQLADVVVQVEQSLAARRGVVSGLLRIGCTTTPGKYILPWLVGSFCQAFPEVRIHVDVIPRSLLVPMLQRQEVNFCVMGGQGDYADLAYEELMDDELVLVVPAGHPFAQAKSVSIDALRGEKIVLREESSGTRLTMLEGMERVGLTVDELNIAQMQLGSPEGIIAAVEAGWGISWLSRIAAGRAVASERIAIVAVDGLRLRRTVFLVSQRGRIETNAHRKFHEYVFSPNGRAIIARQCAGIAL